MAQTRDQKREKALKRWEDRVRELNRLLTEERIKLGIETKPALRSVHESMIFMLSDKLYKAETQVRDLKKILDKHRGSIVYADV